MMKGILVIIILIFPIASLFAQIPTDGLMAYYPFNGNAYDESGNELNITVIGAQLTRDRFSNIDAAYSFDGDNSYLRVPDSDKLDNSKALTLSCWFNANYLGGSYHHDFVPILSKWFSWPQPDSCSYLIYLDGTYINFHINDGVSRDTIAVEINFNINEWVNLVCIFDNGYLLIYVNGEMLISELSEIEKINNSFADLKIGNWYKDYKSQYSSFDGEIDDVRIYNRALTNSEIQDLFNEESTSGGHIYDTFIDPRDGHEYKIIKIGDQWWMAENLNAKQYADGTAIPNVIDDADWDILGSRDKAWCYYENNIENGDVFGALYTWAAAMNGSASSNADPSGVQGVCPDGWHLPSNEEWIQLEMEIGMSRALAETFGYRGTNEGSKLAGNESLWENGVLKEDSEFGSSGFLVLPSGVRQSDGGVFVRYGFATSIWTSTEYSSTVALRRSFRVENTELSLHWGDKVLGRSVRCVRNELELTDIQIHKVDASCYNSSDGAIEITILNEGSFKYKWSTGDTTSTINDIPAGIYLITIFDESGTAYADTISISEPPPIEVEINTTTSCFDGSSGAIGTEVTGGMPPYQYLWNDGQMVSELSNVSSGTYSLIVTDNNSCMLEVEAIVDEFPQIVTGDILGQTIVLPYTVYFYSVNQNTNSTYNWIIDRGNIVSEQGTNSINVQWGQIGTGLVAVVESDINGCIGDTIELEVNIGNTDILSQPAESDLRIWPNPTNINIIIDSPNHLIHSIEITSLSGQLMLSKEMEDNTHQIDLSSFKKGVYFITIRSKDFVTTRKIVKL